MTVPMVEVGCVLPESKDKRRGGKRETEKRTEREREQCMTNP